ncbi:MAG: DUF3015 domain-containing protein [Deltaproteobacteria bacterium]|nr:MAG: DUF3015 domain-containing protein [Deltaproteobacteria bacterium]
MKLIKLFVAMAFLTSTAAVMAGDSSSGCGAGWYIFKKNSLVSSSLRATTNAILLNATFGMTFGTSNCSQHSIVKVEKEAIYFAEANHNQLMLDIARGEGEYLNAFSEIVGCKEDKLGKSLQTNFDKIYSDVNENSVKVLDKIVLHGECTAV